MRELPISRSGVGGFFSPGRRVLVDAAGVRPDRRRVQHFFGLYNV